MAKSFKLTVVSPERLVVDEMCASVIAPATTGYVGIQHGHEPMAVILKPGIVIYKDEKSERKFVSIDSGFMDVKGEEVTVLADNALHSDEIDAEEARKTLEIARKALRGETSGMTTQEATLEIEKAANRLRAAKMS